MDRYVVDGAPTPPAVLERPSTSQGYQYGMLDNDAYGDCVPAAMYHMQETFRLKEGLQPHPWAASTCLASYFHINGVPPGPPGSSSDQGTDPSTAMQYWQTTGLPAHKLAGFGVLQPGSPNVRRAVWEFGTVMYAVALPVEAQDQGVNWRWVPGSQPGSWGGHGIAGDSYTEDLLGFISWAQEGDMDDPFWQNCGEMVLVPLSEDAIGKRDVGPAGFNFRQMQLDLGVL